MIRVAVVRGATCAGFGIVQCARVAIGACMQCVTAGCGQCFTGKSQGNSVFEKEMN
jgi:hypothetical protein